MPYGYKNRERLTSDAFNKRVTLAKFDEESEKKKEA